MPATAVTSPARRRQLGSRLRRPRAL